MTIPKAEVIGDPISQSKSPLIHGFWLEKLDLEGRYERTLVSQDELSAFFAQRRDDPSWRGCNVTMPHKAAVIPFLDALDPLAATVEAVNTVVRSPDGELIGHNTDVAGVAGPLGRMAKAGYPTHFATYVHIIGAGGAARAAAVGAAQAGYCNFAIFNRTREKADALATLIGAPVGSGMTLDQLGPGKDLSEAASEQRYSHVVINASSMGMNGTAPVPIDLAAYPSDTIVFDLVYAPLETPLLAQARALGMRTIDGLEMLIEQAAHAFARFFGAKAPRDHDAELRRLLLR